MKYTCNYYYWNSNVVRYTISGVGYQVGLSVGIPVTFLLTAIISSLLTLLITYLCLTRRGKSHTPQLQEKPVRDPVSMVSSTRPTAAAVEMESNAAFGATKADDENTMYEPMAQ